MAGKPAATLLHCGPGLANGLANLHNARRARTPIVNIVGDQATYHRPLDAPLTADTEGWARGVSGWVRTASRGGDVGRGCRGGGAGGAHRARPDRDADPAVRHLLGRGRRGRRAAAGAAGAARRRRTRSREAARVLRGEQHVLLAARRRCAARRSRSRTRTASPPRPVRG